MNPRSPLVTRRLRLEPVAARHAEGLYQAARASRAELLPWMPWAIDITLQGNQHYAADAERSWEAGEEFHFAVLEDALVLGVMGLNRDPEGSAELHYWIRSDRAGHGYTTEAGECVLRWGVEQLGGKSFPLGAGARILPPAGGPRSSASATSAHCPSRCTAASARSLPKATGEGRVGVCEIHRHARPTSWQRSNSKPTCGLHPPIRSGGPTSSQCRRGGMARTSSSRRRAPAERLET